MGMILKIALRNLIEHKVKSLIVGFIIVIGVLLTFVGNSFFESSAKGVKKSYSENFTGDITVMIKDDKLYSLFGAREAAFGPPSAMPAIPYYQAVYDAIKSWPEIERMTSMVSGTGLLNFEEKGQAFIFLFGIQPDSYFETFNSIKILEGQALRNGDQGILMSRKRLDQIEKENKVTLKVGDPILLNSFGKGGFKVREVPLVGIYEYIVPTQALEIVSFIDVQTLRSLSNMTVGTASDIKIEASERALLDASNNVDDLFGEGSDLFGEVAASTSAALDQKRLDTILGDTSVRKSASQIDSGAWQYILIRLKEGASPEKTIAEFNRIFAEKNLSAKAVGWKDAAGGIAAITDAAQIVFNVIIILLAVVSVIIIMNTLVISVMERTSEIGTMRALGAQKSFIRRMFIAETMTLAGVFGSLGIVVGSLIVTILGAVGVPTGNDFFQVLFGGTVIHPFISLYQITLALLITLGIGMLSWIYPVSVALKIQPIKAIATD